MRVLQALLLSLALTACAAAPERAPFDVVEATIPELQAALAAGRLTSRELVRLYFERIAEHEPGVNAVMAVNPDAYRTAARLDAERSAGRVRGPLHGIPIALKDIIHTTDMPTTGGALAFEGFVPPYDATVTARLREAGVIIIAKTVHTELANWVAADMPANYSALGGYGRNPYGPDLSPGGSSSGAGTAASFWAASVGTETSGSILNPSNWTMLAAIKPTVGRISRYGIIPITADQDTAGPMARTVTDAALLFGALEGVDPNDPATGRCEAPPDGDYTPHLRADALAGARIGVPRARFYDGLDEFQRQALDAAITVLREAGATVVDPADPPGVADFFEWPICYGEDARKGADEHCSVVLKYGMKRDFNAYLATLGADAPVPTLTTLREFNLANADRGAIRYGQVQLDISDEMDVAADRQRYEADRAKDIRLSATEGIDAVLREHRLDALLFPGARGAGFAARPGYPTVIVPFAGPEPAPFGVAFTGTACSEPALLGLGYAFEQATSRRVPPTLAR